MWFALVVATVSVIGTVVPGSTRIEVGPNDTAVVLSAIAPWQLQPVVETPVCPFAWPNAGVTRVRTKRGTTGPPFAVRATTHARSAAGPSGVSRSAAQR